MVEAYSTDLENSQKSQLEAIESLKKSKEEPQNQVCQQKQVNESFQKIEEESKEFFRNSIIEQNLDENIEQAESINRSQELLFKFFDQVFEEKPKNEQGLRIFKYKGYQMNFQEIIKAKVLMFVGGTGTGKTTLLNCFVNHFYRIPMESDVRLVITDEEDERDQTQSQTKKIKAYYLPPFGDLEPLILIDTPGYGDTKSKEQDKEFDKLYFEFFGSSFVPHLNGVFIVSKATDNRVGLQEKYICHKLKSIFGNDISKRLIFLFCHKVETQNDAINSVLSQDSFGEFKDVLIQQDEEDFLFFDNTIMKQSYEQITAQNKTKALKSFRYQFENSQESFNKLFSDFFPKLQPISLKQTTENLVLRTELEEKLVYAQRLESQMNRVIQRNKEILLQISQNQSSCFWSQKMKLLQFVKKEVGIDRRVLNCRKCKRTCLSSSETQTTEKTEDLAVFRRDLQLQKVCKVCTCQATEHALAKQTYVNQAEELELTLSMALTYVPKMKDKSDLERLRIGIQYRELELIHVLFILRLDMSDIIADINNIGMVPVDLIDVFKEFALKIDSEEENREQGYEERVKTYKFLLGYGEKQGFMSYFQNFHQQVFLTQSDERKRLYKQMRERAKEGQKKVKQYALNTKGEDYSDAFFALPAFSITGGIFSLLMTAGQGMAYSAIATEALIAATALTGVGAATIVSAIIIQKGYRYYNGLK